MTPLKLKRCRKCGFVSTDAADAFCPNDGDRLLDACPHCAAALRYPLAEFCPSCGRSFFHALDKENSAASSASSSRRKAVD